MSAPTLGPVHAPDFPAGLPWLNAARPLSLHRDLRGSFVLLDFWTFGCITCLHLLDPLAELGEEFADVLHVIGVHSAKFPNEGRPQAVRASVEKYGVRHPVVVDEQHAVRDAYAVRAWPSLVLVDPSGYVLAHQSGELAVDRVREVLIHHLTRARTEGTVSGTALPTSLDDLRQDELLAYPSGIAFNERGNRLYIADTNHHRILEADVNGRILRTFGDTDHGLQDGDARNVRFKRPHGLAIDPRRGALLVADTGNHAVRSLDLHSGVTRTIVGHGARSTERRTRIDGPDAPLNSPWDVQPVDRQVFVAMAGSHEIWTFDVDSGRGHLYAGSGVEGRSDRDRLNAHLAQPSALSSDGTWLYFADSESSCIRRLRFGSLLERVETLAGDDLFDFGDVDGMGAAARLQHPMGLVWHEGVLYVADTYNHKIKRLFPDARTIVSFLGTGSAGWADGSLFGVQFNEPSAITAGAGRLFIADTNNHAVRVASLSDGSVTTLALKPVATP